MRHLGRGEQGTEVRWNAPNGNHRRWLLGVIRFSRIAGSRFVVRFSAAVSGLLFQAEALGHFFVEEAFSGDIGLNPLSIDDELRDGAFAGAFDDFFGGSGSGFDVDVDVGELVLVEEALGGAAIRTPGGGVDGDFHGSD